MIQQAKAGVCQWCEALVETTYEKDESLSACGEQEVADNELSIAEPELRAKVDAHGRHSPDLESRLARIDSQFDQFLWGTLVWISYC